MPSPPPPEPQAASNEHVLLVFLEMFNGVRAICASCLARLADDALKPVTAWLERRVTDGTVVRATAPCLNCEDSATVYALPRLL